MLRTAFSRGLKPIQRTTVLESLLNNSSCFYSSDSHYDIIIVGGGLIGTTLACTLGKNKYLSDRSILLLEAGKKRDWKLSEEYSNVVCSLNPGTYNLLNEIGVWDHIKSARFATVKGMQVWESNSEAMINFNSDNAHENISYIVENNVTLKSVYQELETLENVTVVNEALIDAFEFEGQRKNHQLILKNGKTYTTDLLLGCDGWKSRVREQMGIHYVSWDYNQVGLVATLELQEECDNSIAWQRFLPNGPIALLPLNKKLSSLVWTTTPQQGKELLALTEEEFVDKLNRSLWDSPKKNSLVEGSTKNLDRILGAFNLQSAKGRQVPSIIAKCQAKSRATFPLGFGHATNYIMKGVALVGDAAHRVHPLAGQGVNLGFGDISCLNTILGKAAYDGSELGSLLYLKEYETQRQRHNVPTMLAIDGLQRLYGSDSTVAVLLRSLGLQAVNALQPLKALIKNHAAS